MLFTLYVHIQQKENHLKVKKYYDYLLLAFFFQIQSIIIF